MPPMTLPRLFIDADACPVKDEVYRVAARYDLQVFVVSNSWINTPRESWIEQVVVDAGPDIADDWIAERAGPGDVVITADIPLADRCLKTGAQALKSNGQPFTPDSIGSALAGRMVGEHLQVVARRHAIDLVLHRTGVGVDEEAGRGHDRQ